MKQRESVTFMGSMLVSENRPRFSDPARNVARARNVFRNTRRQAVKAAVIPGPTRRGRLADDLREPRAEGAKRSTADLQAHLSNGEFATPKEPLRTFDAPSHKVAVRRLTVGRVELPREMRRRHESRPGKGGDVQGMRVVAIHQISGAPQVGEVGEFLWGHNLSIAEAPESTPIRSASP